MLKLIASAVFLVASADVPPGIVDGTKRLEIVNGCSAAPMWIAHIVEGGVGPDSQDNKLLPGESTKFTTSLKGAGLTATRYWPKMGCDDSGNHCTIGDSGGPAEGCVIHNPWGDDYSHCAPPVDTKFEASFAPPDNPTVDVVDMSLVDGYSLPFKLEVTHGSCNIHTAKDPSGPAVPFKEMDCSKLSFHNCPNLETLNGETMSLQAINPETGKVSGCYSPCMRLTDDKWVHSTLAPDSTEAAPYCCAGADVTPDTCQAGPVLTTQYLKSVKESCPAAYGYPFDDKTATITCTTTTQYKVTFYCPIDILAAMEGTPVILMM